MRQRDERGDGLIDVMVGVLIFGILAAAIVATLTTLDRVTANVSGSSQASALASRLLSDAQAGGCGQATGATSPSDAKAILSRCTWGSNGVSALADVVATDNSTAPNLCTDADYATQAPADTVGTGACYRIAHFTYTASIRFAWGWAVPPSGQSASTWSACQISQGEVYNSPTELLRTAVVRWPDHLVSTTAFHSRTVTETGAVPAALETESAGGDLGGLVVTVDSTTPQDVGLVVPGLSAPIVEQTSPAGAGDCVTFPFLPPSASGYQVWVGNTSNLYTSPAVDAGTWSSVEGAAAS